MTHQSIPHHFLWWFCTLCAFLVSPAWAGDAGKIAAFSGAGTLLSVDGKPRQLEQGGVMRQGETVVTGKDGQVDLHFTDGARVQLRPNTQFRVDEYNYVALGKGKTDGNEKGFFSLVKGGLRVVSGMIGKLRQTRYVMATPVATIGIRGTDYSATLDERNGLLTTVAQGEIVLANQAGSFSVLEGQSAYVADIDSAPTYRQASEASRGPAAAGRRSNTGVKITGKTRIEANTKQTNAVAVGQENRASNQAGVIGGD